MWESYLYFWMRIILLQHRYWLIKKLIDVLKLKSRSNRLLSFLINWSIWVWSKLSYFKIQLTNAIILVNNTLILNYCKLNRIKSKLVVYYEISSRLRIRSMINSIKDNSIEGKIGDSWLKNNSLSSMDKLRTK